MARKGAGGRETDRLSIRVVPGTDGFREELEKKLNAEIRGVSIEIPVGLDTTKAIAALKVFKDKVESMAITVKVTADTSAALAKIRALQAELNKSHLTINADVDTSKIRQDLAGLKDSAQPVTIPATVKVNPGQVAQDIKDALGGGADASALNVSLGDKDAGKYAKAVADETKKTADALKEITPEAKKTAEEFKKLEDATKRVIPEVKHLGGETRKIGFAKLALEQVADMGKKAETTKNSFAGINDAAAKLGDKARSIAMEFTGITGKARDLAGELKQAINAKGEFGGLERLPMLIANAKKGIRGLGSLLHKEIGNLGGDGDIIDRGLFRPLGRGLAAAGRGVSAAARKFRQEIPTATGVAGKALSSLGRAFAFTGKSAAAGARLATRGITGLAKASTSGFGKAVKGLGKYSLSPLTLGLRGLVKVGSSVGSMFGSMSRGGLIFVAVLVLIAPLVALIATALASLPSAVSAAGAAFAAIALGMDGIKKATKVLQPQVDSLKKTLSSTFEKGLTPIFKELGAKVFPVLQTGLNQVAGSLVGLAGEFTKVVTSKVGLEQINTILSQSGKFLADLKPMVAGFAGGFLTLASEGAKNFGMLSSVLNDFGTQFAAMSDRVAKNGTLKNALQGLSLVLGSVLGLFLKLMESGLGAMGQLGAPLANLVTSIGNAFVALMPFLTTLSVVVSNVLAKALDALTPIITALTPGFTVLSNTIGVILVGAINALSPILLPLAKFISDTLVVVLNSIPVDKIVNFLVTIGQQIGGFLVQAFEKLSPLIEEAAKFVGQLIDTFLRGDWGSLVSVWLQSILDILDEIVPALLDFGKQVGPLIIQVIEAAMPLLIEVGKFLAENAVKIGEIVALILEKAIPVVKDILQVVLDNWPLIQKIIEDGMAVISDVINIVLDLIKGNWSGAWEDIKKLLGDAWDGIKDVLKLALKAIPGLIKTILLDGAQFILGDAGRKIMQGFLDGLKKGWEWVTNFVGGIKDWIVDHKGPVSADRVALIPAGKAMMAGLNSGLKTGFGAVQAYVTDMSSVISDQFTGIKLDPQLDTSSLDAFNGMDITSESLASAQIQADVSSPEFRSLPDRIEEALSGWSVQMDANGLAKLVNTSNLRKARRG